MGKLTMLKPRVQTLKTSTARTLVTERVRGRALQVIRERILRRAHGLCECDECRAGPPRLAVEVDHRVPLWEGGADDDSNRQALSLECHDRKTKAEAARRAALGR